MGKGGCHKKNSPPGLLRPSTAVVSLALVKSLHGFAQLFPKETLVTSLIGGITTYTIFLPFSYLNGQRANVTLQRGKWQRIENAQSRIMDV